MCRSLHEILQSTLKILLRVYGKALIQRTNCDAWNWRNYLCLVSQLSTRLTFWLGSCFFPAYFVPTDMAEGQHKENHSIKALFKVQWDKSLVTVIGTTGQRLWF